MPYLVVMKHLTTLLALLLSFTMVGQSNLDYNPDYNGDGFIGVEDILGVLGFYDTPWEEVSAWSCGDPLSYHGYDYETVLIGYQCWFGENLRNENYQNGDVIPGNLDDSEWSSTTTGAVSIYGESAVCDNFSPDINACDPNQSLVEFGRLYNWHAVDDVRGLCPSGWHVPTIGEWTVMTEHLGGESSAGDQLKSTYGWWIGGNGSNSSGFAGLPGGFRNNLGWFSASGANGHWWSSTLNFGTTPAYGELSSTNDNFSSDGLQHSSNHGLSVRCIQD